MNSIGARVRRVFVLALTFCWICGVGLIAATISSNEHGLWDGRLQSFGTRLLLSLPAEEINEGPFGPNLELPPEVQRDPENFAIQVWSVERKLVIRSPQAPLAPLQPSFRNGFATLEAGGQTWRVYTVSDRHSRVTVQVANLQSVIQREMVGETLAALALMTALHTEPLDLARLAEHVLREYAYHAERLGCMLDAELAPARVDGNLDELATLLRNLLDNAVRFARDGGRVLLACGVDAHGPWLSVADDGPVVRAQSVLRTRTGSPA